MEPEHCPFHRRVDTCMPTALLPAQAGVACGEPWRSSSQVTA
ncbi:hypothetical protein AB0H17_27000 [Streptomyces olivoreticuli]